MKIKIFAIFQLVAISLFFGCTDSNDIGSDTGKLSIQLTDAPFPHDLVAEANVTIFKIDARNKDMEPDTAMEGEMTDETDASFVVLMLEEIEVNLLDLTNGITESMVNTEVPVGSYDLVRVYVKGVNVVLADGTTYNLEVPSGEKTGIKIFIAPDLVVKGGFSSDLLLDFDVSRSFVPKGNSQELSGITGFNFKPVIKAANLSTAGTLTGLVTTMQEEASIGLEGAQVSIFAADTLNTTTFSDETGAYSVLGLTAGTYEVEVELEGYVSQEVEDVEIIAANKTALDFELELEPVEEGN